MWLAQNTWAKQEILTTGGELSVADLCAISISLIGIIWYLISFACLLRERNNPLFRRSFLIGSLTFPILTFIVFLIRQHEEFLNPPNDFLLLAILAIFFFIAMGFDVPFFFLYPYARLKNKGEKNSESDGVTELVGTLLSHSQNAKLIKALVGAFIGVSILTTAESLFILQKHIGAFAAKLFPIFQRLIAYGRIFAFFALACLLFSYLFSLSALFMNRKEPRVRYCLSIAPPFPPLVFLVMYWCWINRGLDPLFEREWIIFPLALIVFSEIYFDVPFFFLYPYAYFYDKVRKDREGKGVQWLEDFTSLPWQEKAALYGLIMILWFSLSWVVIYVFLSPRGT